MHMYTAIQPEDSYTSIYNSMKTLKVKKSNGHKYRSCVCVMSLPIKKKQPKRGSLVTYRLNPLATVTQVKQILVNNL